MAFIGQLNADGDLMEVGGVREKLNGAYTNKIDKIIMPTCMKYAVKELKKEFQEKFTFIYVDTFFDAVEYLFP
ncbi:unnamed protein product [Meloidogyne enterolobii]|uniref:Lon proteolytic domain-containing protein n=2 Tax=Meloidogyne enterolobii TaxID=390850 RepID=A0A6V7WXB7_MELEN|nr:unnamed protein product [Meloidogyne enterolobii]